MDDGPTDRLGLPAAVPLPQLEVLVGGAWFAVGAVVAPAGPGTVAMALGLGATAALWSVVRRHHGAGPKLGVRLRAAVVRTGVVVLAALVGLGVLASAAGWGELTVPAAAAAVGFGFLALAHRLGDRAFVAVGTLLLLLSALGAVLALRTAGPGTAQAVVGIAGALLTWLAGASRTGLLREIRHRTLR